MNSKTIIAGILGGICSFLLGWLLYGIVFKNMMADMMGSATGVMRSDSEMVFWALLLGNLLIGCLVAYIFNCWASISTFMGGLTGGATIGLLFTVAFDLIFYATTNVTTISGIAVDVVINLLIWAISSGVVGWWLGRSK